MTSKRTESVSFGHETIGTIRETDRGFECFDASGAYLFTDPTLAGARKALYRRAVEQAGGDAA
jgi:hypothetical protein